MFWDLNLCLTHQPKWKRHCDWVMTSNYILDMINSFKRNGCIRLLERSGLSQYRKVRKQDNIKFENHHFFSLYILSKRMENLNFRLKHFKLMFALFFSFSFFFLCFSLFKISLFNWRWKFRGNEIRWQWLQRNLAVIWQRWGANICVWFNFSHLGVQFMGLF